MNGRAVDRRGWEREGGNDVQGEHWLHGCGILKVVCRRNLGCRCSSGIVGVRLEEGTLMGLEGTSTMLCCRVCRCRRWAGVPLELSLPLPRLLAGCGTWTLTSDEL